jgi:hypothetical protein
MSEFIKKIVNGDLESFRTDIFNTLYNKAGEILDNRKVEIANNMYSEGETSEEEQIEDQDLETSDPEEEQE